MNLYKKFINLDPRKISLPDLLTITTCVITSAVFLLASVVMLVLVLFTGGYEQYLFNFSLLAVTFYILGELIYES